MPDLTDRTLASWLRNSHNFPDTMDFTIADSQIDDLSFYILSLRKSRYSPPIQ